MNRKEQRLDGIEDLFAAADEDCDDQISLTEFRGLMLSLGREMRDDAVTANFLKIDTNRDGRIKFDEFRDWWLQG